MMETLLARIKTTLEGVALVKDTFSYPKSKLTKFPAVFFIPDGFANRFETNQENFKTYRFLLIVMIGISGGVTKENVFTSTMPKVVDNIVAEFDENWQMNAIDGHKVWIKLDNADPWQFSEEQDGLVAYAPMYLEVKLLSTN